ncbi:MAG: hypothetical protein ACLUEK_07365 [Oscillospiraceae bacterium]
MKKIFALLLALCMVFARRLRRVRYDREPGPADDATVSEALPMTALPATRSSRRRVRAPVG